MRSENPLADKPGHNDVAASAGFQVSLKML